MNININTNEVEIRHRKFHNKIRRSGYSNLDSKYYREYKIFNNITTRCYNKDVKMYQYYGAKGIRLCDEWLNNFPAFLDWLLENGYEPDAGLSIERLDECKGYSPENCIIVDRKVNSSFKGNTEHFIVDGALVSISDLKRMYPEHKKCINAYKEADLVKYIPEMLRELGVEEPIKYVTKEQIYKNMGIIK